MEKRFLTWEYIDNAMSDLASKIKESGITITSIYGLPRGGLIPAVMLSHKLNIPLFKSGYDVLVGSVLIVDDICDTGETLEKYTNYPIATIHHKQTAMVEPMFYYSLVRGNAWIVYPWENDDSETIADYKK
jgi:hypoxanthine phosphoribosyltransferase